MQASNSDYEWANNSKRNRAISIFHILPFGVPEKFLQIWGYADFCWTQILRVYNLWLPLGVATSIFPPRKVHIFFTVDSTAQTPVILLIKMGLQTNRRDAATDRNSGPLLMNPQPELRLFWVGFDSLTKLYLLVWPRRVGRCKLPRKIPTSLWKSQVFLSTSTYLSTLMNRGRRGRFCLRFSNGRCRTYRYPLHATKLQLPFPTKKEHLWC